MRERYFIVTYGCQMNVHESEKIAGLLRAAGYESADSQENADLIVFNTCCVRENAENHAFGNIGALKKLKKQKKNLIIAVGGCMTQEKGKAETLKEKFPFIDVIFGTLNLEELPALIQKKREEKKRVIKICEKEGEIVEDVKPFRTSFPNAWVNIAYGCNNFCSYCIVPYVRGRERSRKEENILAEIRLLVEQGYKEITLLGQNVNSYGNDLKDGSSFARLLDKAASIEGKFRLRFMTSHPKDFNADVVEVMKKHPKICRLVHLPVQSGSNEILRRMNRRYTAEEYLNKIQMLKSAIPQAEVTTDIIVGFPGETEEDYLQTEELVKKADFASAFTFVYSKRSGTKAAEMPDQVPEDVSKNRIMRLVELVNTLTRKKSETYVGKTVEILCEDYDEKKKAYLGRDEFGRMAYFPYPKNVVGRFVRVNVLTANGISLFGEVAEVED
ncbi:MAG: tRNA (N6-isopentenyl adenosine(37)-C2)-methylthiotransferase MiaB [Candidatus Borkfalkiaceae bacterium]|nr:tRNA (N6-isopentenyl adenosine(37)-C2)-methylthiotransferase MiaB [Clostridia bacterium]MDY6222616.1 tRNA (N6-isopentenyl adenosine(37)-C2)-methylthiotransferase MiaB [Christensenellaceae bacterium]